MENEKIYRIESDKDAEKCLLSIKEIKEDYQRQINVCVEMIAEYKHKISEFEKKQVDSIRHYESQLQEYFSRVKVKESKTQHSYKLPSGSLIKKLPVKQIKLNETYSESNIPEEYIKVERSIKWSEFKKNLIISGDNVVNSKTGEIVNACSIEVKPEEFNIKI